MKFFQGMMQAYAGQMQGQPQPQVPNTSVSREAYDELQDRLAKLEALILAQNNPKPAAETTARRA